MCCTQLPGIKVSVVLKEIVRAVLLPVEFGNMFLQGNAKFTRFCSMKINQNFEIFYLLFEKAFICSL